MGFWIFIVVMLLIVPITMIGFGKGYIKSTPSKIDSGPKEMNMVYGYRTSMSMKNKDTYEFAQNYCGKLWFRLGTVLLPVSIIPMFFVLGKDEDTVGSFSLIIIALQVVCLIGSIFPTEKALKKNFDRDGNLR